MSEFQFKNLLNVTFGQTQDDSWQALAERIGAEFVPGVRDGWGTNSKVVYRVKPWTITLEALKYGTSSHPGNYVMHTRLRANYLTGDYFSFWVSPAGLLDELKGFFGLENERDVKIGQPDLDRNYVFSGSDREQTRRLFADTNLQRMLAWLGEISYGVKGADERLSKTYRKRSFQLFYEYPGLIYNATRLRVMFELFAETLEQLRRIGSAIADE